jgi:hypothetical protein
MTRDGSLRRDSLNRTLRALGAPRDRWDLALRLARASGLARRAGGELTGFPEARPRGPEDPPSLLDYPAAGALICKIAGPTWIDLSALLELLRDRLRIVLHGPGGYIDRPSLGLDDMGWEQVEAPALRGAANSLHRLGVIDAALGPDGVIAFRDAGPPPRRALGFLLTPDLDILVAPGELHPTDYGRLCRLAPFLQGDRVHRHKLTRAGVAADLRAGNLNIAGFLEQNSRTGLPDSVAASVHEWARSAAKIRLLTQVTVVERAGRLVRVDGITEPPPGFRVIDYTTDAPPAARFEAEGDALRVPVGEDALTVRAALSRVASVSARDVSGIVYAVTPTPLQDAEGVLTALRGFHEGPLPGSLEVAVRAAQGLPAVSQEEAVVLHLPEAVADALARDRVAAAWLDRPIGAGQFVVGRLHLEALRGRAEMLGLRWER